MPLIPKAILLNLFFLYSLCSFSPAQMGHKLPDQFQLIPYPKNIELLTAKVGLEHGDLVRLKIEKNVARPVLGNILDNLTELPHSGNRTLTLRLDSSANVPKLREGYVLTIANGNAEVISRDEAGLFYGCQTLEQLLEDSRDTGIAIPACRITDYPDYSYRSVHFDSKHHLDHINYYYESIDRLARYKVNAITWEFEDKLRYQEHPSIGGPQAISIDEMAALTRYARIRNIEITPLVQGLGHATYILKHEKYAYLREVKDNKWAFCPLHEGGYQVLFDLYREAIKATPGSKFFHIGGDEIGNIGLCPRCKHVADEKGVFELNLYWINRVCEFLEKQGRIPILWNDMPFKYAGVWQTTREEKDSPELWKEGIIKLENIINRFPDKAVFMHWNYTSCRQPGNERLLEWLTTHRPNTMIATAAHSGSAALFPFDDRTGNMSDRGITAIKSSIQSAYEKGINGVLTTAWDDRSPHMETYWRGFIASAEYSWNTGGSSLDEFQKAYMQREFGTQVNYTELYFKLRSAAHFWETSLVRKGNRMDIENALLDLPGVAHWVAETQRNGKKNRGNYKEIVTDLPDLDNPGQWSRKYSERLNNAEKQLIAYNETSQKLGELYKASMRNRYHWKLFSALNDFQITAPKLLLALKRCDVANKAEQKKGFASVQEALKNFDAAWANLKAVYEETRYISCPDNYVKDRYFHFASQREDLTWMIQVEELLHRLIRKWLEKNNPS